MSDEGKLIAFGSCFRCQTTFTFDPDTVASILIDPVTQLPPDMGGDPERATRMPVCPECVAEVNPLRAKAGLPTWREP